MDIINSLTAVTMNAVTTLWTACNKVGIWRYMDLAETIDATGMLCPLPVLKLRKRLKPLAPGQCIEMLADDPAAIIDVPHFCTEAGHELVSATEENGVQTYVVRKTGTVRPDK